MIQEYADRWQHKEFYDSLKAIYGPRIESARLLLDPVSNIPSSQPEDIMEIWHDHFCGLLNQPSSIDWPTVEALAQHEMKDSLAREPSLSEVQKALG